MNTIETALRSYRYLLQKHHPTEEKQIACATAALDDLAALRSAKEPTLPEAFLAIVAAGEPTEEELSKFSAETRAYWDWKKKTLHTTERLPLAKVAWDAGIEYARSAPATDAMRKAAEERPDWENMSDEDLNRQFARAFFNRPIDERNNTYWHDDDKTPDEENHEWKPLPNFCNDWSAVRSLLVESKFVLPIHHGVPQDKRSRCRRAMVDMLILERCSRRPTAHHLTAQAPATASASVQKAAEEAGNLESLMTAIRSSIDAVNNPPYFDKLPKWPEARHELIHRIRKDIVASGLGVSEDTARLEWLLAGGAVRNIDGYTSMMHYRVDRAAIDAARSQGGAS